MKTWTYYLHTIDGRPAYFERNHLVFGHKRIKPALSLKQIKREQKAAIKWDEESVWMNLKLVPVRYGYVTITVPR